MAKLNGLRALWSASTVESFIEEKVSQFENDAVETLMYLGDEFVNKARTKTKAQGGFADHTGNVRSSIGFIVASEGKVVHADFKEGPNGTDRSTGVAKAKLLADTLLRETQYDVVLIGFAGMEYAAYVEAYNWDVITGSAPDEKMVKQFFQEIINRQRNENQS